MSRRPQEPADPGRAAAGRPAADIIHALILTASAQIPRTASEAGRGALSARDGNWSPCSPRAAPTHRSPPSCTSASAPSVRTWTGSGIRPAAATALTWPAWPSVPDWSNPARPAGARPRSRSTRDNQSLSKLARQRISQRVAAGRISRAARPPSCHYRQMYRITCPSRAPGGGPPPPGSPAGACVVPDNRPLSGRFVRPVVVPGNRTAASGWAARALADR
jgi:hypothetical protein